MKKKLILGGLAGGLAYFILGFLIYAIMLEDFSSLNMNTCHARPASQMVWWALLGSNLLMGLMLAMVLDWAGSNDMGSAMRTSELFGTIYALAVDLGVYSMTTTYNDIMALAVDVAGSIVIATLSGILIGWVYSRVR